MVRGGRRLRRRPPRSTHMARFSFIGRRLLQLIPVLFGITVITFFLLRLIPGDPALQILGQHYTKAGAIEVRHSLGLDRPLWRQYVLFVQRLFQGDLGDSITFKQSAGSLIAERLPPTLFLVAYAAIVAVLISVPAGVVS